MGTARCFGIIVSVLLVLLTPIAGASEGMDSGDDAEIQVEPKSGRADGMPAWSVDSGGGESSGGDFSLIAAIGQPDTGVLSGGGAVLAGGVWAGEMNLGFVFGDGFESGDTGSWSLVVGGNP